MSHTYQARDFAPKVAARFGKGLIGDCIRMGVADGKAGRRGDKEQKAGNQ